MYHMYHMNQNHQARFYCLGDGVRVPRWLSRFVCLKHLLHLNSLSVRSVSLQSSPRGPRLNQFTTQT